MKIKLIEIQNFRKLKCCRIELNEKETVFVGANNSGKTSAMDALILFLKKSRRKEISTTDFTITNWNDINKIGQKWLKLPEDEAPDLSIETWRPLIPALDIWLSVDVSELHYVIKLIPELAWEGGDIGIRLILEPEIEKLYKDFKKEYTSAFETIKKSSNGKESKLTLWPKDLKDFLDKKLHSYFSIKAYSLNPKELNITETSEAKPQKLPENSEPFDKDYLEGLFKIDVINAQRGFYDATSEGTNSGNLTGGLTSQSKSLFKDHLDPEKEPTINDIAALEAIETARQSFDEKLNSSFKSVIDELKNIGYPGFTDPNIKITSKINFIDSLNHDSAVRFNVLKTEGIDDDINYLPERYNGLGYQNLISMVLKLIRFRYEWMREGKASKTKEDENDIIEPLHLVLIEEPEAHLHAQVQQVFIKKAYEILRNHTNLKNSKIFATQLIVSTHSSHIAHEIDFKCLRYFRKTTYECGYNLPCATVVNLSQTFGTEVETEKFVTRYLKLTHCDLLFADAAILVEGPAEKILIPDFIKQNYPLLDSKYITLLEIGGSHAHRFKALIDNLKIITLIVTDVDSKDGNNKKKQPERNTTYKTGNNSLKTWIPQKENLIELLDLKDEEKISENSLVRIAYQYPFNVEFIAGQSKEFIPYTFEDALVFSNIKIFKNWSNAKGLIKKMQEALNKTTIEEASTTIFDALEDGKKAEMALELLFIDDTLTPPQYIADGLKWMQDKLNIELRTNVEKKNKLLTQKQELRHAIK